MEEEKRIAKIETEQAARKNRSLEARIRQLEDNLPLATENNHKKGSLITEKAQPFPPVKRSHSPTTALVLPVNGNRPFTSVNIASAAAIPFETITTALPVMRKAQEAISVPPKFKPNRLHSTVSDGCGGRKKVISFPTKE